MTGSLDFDMEAVSAIKDCKAGDMEVDISNGCELDSLNTNGLASPVENGKMEEESETSNSADVTNNETNGISDSHEKDEKEEITNNIELTQDNESDDSDKNESDPDGSEKDENIQQENEVNDKDDTSKDNSENIEDHDVSHEASDDQEKEAELKTKESETEEQSDKPTSVDKDEDSPMEEVNASATEENDEKEVSKPTNNIELRPDDSDDDNSEAESEEHSTEKSVNVEKKKDVEEKDNKEITNSEVAEEKEAKTASTETSVDENTEEEKVNKDTTQEEADTKDKGTVSSASSSEAGKSPAAAVDSVITFNKIDADSDDEDMIQEKDQDEVILEEEVETTTNQSEKRKADTEPEEPTKKARLEHLDKSLRKLRKMDRKDLENLLKKKLIEMFVYKEELGNLRRQCDKFKKSAESWKEQSEILSKNLKDLSTVQRKYMSETKEAMGDKFVKPTKITRSVGLMVMPPEKRAKKKVTGPGGPHAARRLQPSAAAGQQQQQSAQRPAMQAAASTATAAQARPATNGPQYINAAVAANNALANRTNTQVRQINGVYRTTAAQNGAARPANNSAVLSNGLATSQPQRIQTQPQQSRPSVPSPRQAPSNNPEVVDLSDDDTPVALPSPQQVMRPGLTVRPVQTMRQIPQQRAVLRHPAPLPISRPPQTLAYGNLKQLPPKPSLTIGRGAEGVVLKWNMQLNLFLHEPVISYQIWAYQELPNSVPDASSWKKVGDVKALPLPMACTLKQFSVGNKYHFSVRAMDSHKRVGPYSDPTSISV